MSFGTIEQIRLIERVAKDVDRGGGNEIDRKLRLFVVEFRGVERAAEVVPRIWANQPLIAVGELLPTESPVQVLAANLNVSLAEIKIVVTLGSELSGNIWPVREPFVGVLTLRVEFQPISRLESKAEPEAIEDKYVIVQRRDILVEVKGIFPRFKTNPLLDIEADFAVQEAERICFRFLFGNNGFSWRRRQLRDPGESRGAGKDKQNGESDRQRKRPMTRFPSNEDADY